MILALTRRMGFVPLLEVLAAELAKPAAEPEALLAVRVLDRSIERDVLRAADHDLSRSGSPFAGVVTSQSGMILITNLLCGT